MVYLAADYIFNKFSYVRRYFRQSLPIPILMSVWKSSSQVHAKVHFFLKKIVKFRMDANK